MAQAGYKWEDVELVYNLVGVHGSVSKAARSFIPPMAVATAQNHYDAAISKFRKADVRKLHKEAIAYDPENPPKSDLTEKITHLNAVVVAFSDAHWTSIHQPRSLAHEALLKVIPQVKPDILLSVGDLLDMGEPSRHDPLGWHKRIKVQDELEAAKKHLKEKKH